MKEDGDLTSLFMLVSDRGLKEIKISSYAKIVSCWGNKLTTIDIPEGVTTLWCQNNQLRSLKLPESLNILECDKELFDYDNNNLTLGKIFYE